MAVLKEWVVQWKYSSSLGIYAEGEVVTLDDATAAHLNRDSAGVLVEKKKAKAPAAHRMVTGDVVENRAMPQPEATDAAVKLAREYGLNLADVPGTGAGGKIIKSDVEAAIG